MIRISVCMIAKNEADNIGRCLRSVKAVADEIIVVDTGSTDETVKIAETHGAKVFSFRWINDFSAARNYALEQAEGDWIVFLDADEYIVDEKIANLRPTLEKIHGNRKVEAVSCMMEHTEGPDGPLKGRDRTVRLFRNSPAIRFKGKIHEFIYKRDRFTRSAHADESVLVIRHSGYSQEKFAEKLLRNHALLETCRQEGNDDGMIAYYLGHSYWAMRRFDKAAEFARKAIAKGDVFLSMFACKVYVVLIDSLLQLGTYGPEAIEPVIAEALQKYPHHPELLKCQGYYQRSRGQFARARETLLSSLAANEKYNDVVLANEYYINISQVHAAIAELYALANQPVQAFEHSLAAVRSRKTDELAFAGLISAVRPQKAADIVCLLNSIYDLHAEADVAFLVNRLAALKEKQLFVYYEKIWANRFGHKEFTAMKLFVSGHFAQALPLFAASFRESGDNRAEVLATVSVLQGDDPRTAEMLGPQRSPSLARIIDAFFRAENASPLMVEDFPPYLALMENFAGIGDEDRLQRLTDIAFLFPVQDAPARVAAALVRQKMYRQAGELYIKLLGLAGNRAAGELYCRAGFCRYKLRDYETAVSLFAEALAVGADAGEVGEYLAWCRQLCSDAAVRDKIGALRLRYGLFPDEPQEGGPGCSGRNEGDGDER